MRRDYLALRLKNVFISRYVIVYPDNFKAKCFLRVVN